MAYIYENDVGRLGGNLQKTVGYLLSLHKAEYEWNLLGIKVVGHVDALPIPNGTYEYGDAYTVGTAAPYDIWIYTRADEFHAEAYWFNIGKFPAPGPQGPKGDGVETFTSIDTGSSQYATYDTTDGISATYDAIIKYKDSTTGESKSKTVSLNTKTPILPGKYISIGNRNSRNVEVGVDDTALALDYIKIDKTKNSVVPLYLNGSISWPQVTGSSAPNSVPYRDGNGYCSFRKVDLSPEGFTIDNNKFDKTIMIYGLQSDLSIADKTGGTLTNNESYVINNTPVCRIKIQDKVYYRVSQFGKSPVTFMSCDSTGTIYTLTCDTTNKTYTISQATSTTYYTHRVVIYDGSDNAYYTITLTNSRADAYENLEDQLTSLFNDIGTSGVMAYKNTAEGAYVPVLLTRDATSQSAIHWQTGTQTGTIEQSNVADIQDHITPAITNN